MLDIALVDELLVAVKNLSSQISALSLTLSQAASPGEELTVGSRAGSEFAVETASCVGFDDGQGRRNRLQRASGPTLPDSRLIRRIIRQRQQRDRFFNEELLSDPVWDMLLDLTAATAEYRKVSVTSLCIASRVPPTTALRWIGLMTEQGLLQRVEDPLDRRRVFISLSDEAMNAMARYFQSLGFEATTLI